MKPDQERDALKGLLDIAGDTEKVVKNTVQWSLVYFVIFLALAILLSINVYRQGAVSAAGLFFAAGVFATLSYVRFIESRGIKFMGSYFNLTKAKSRYSELVSTQGESDASFPNPFKFFLYFILAIGTSYFAMYLLDNYGNA